MATIDWASACLVTLYETKRDRYGSTRFRGYKSTEYCRYGGCVVVLIKVREGTKGITCDQQESFRKGRGCMNQIFALRCEKY